MKKLNLNWFFEEPIDFEFKKYTLLAYIQSIKKSYNQNKIYPELVDLINQYDSIILFKKNKNNISDNFKNKVIGLDFINKKLLYSNLKENNITLQTIDNVIDFSIPIIKESIDEGTNIYEKISQEINIGPVGIIPVYKKEGYMLIKTTNFLSTYRYKLSHTIELNEQFNILEVTHMEDLKFSINITYESIKRELIISNSALPNPAVYYIEIKKDYPIKESVIPIAKRKLLQVISS